MCYVIPKAMHADIVHAASTHGSELNLIVKVHDELHDDDTSSQAVTLPFVAAFTLSTYQVHFNGQEDGRTKNVAVIGVPRQLDALMVCWLTQ